MRRIRKYGFPLGLILGFGAMLGLVTFVTIVGLQHLDSIQDHSETIVENHMAKIELATTMYTSARQRIVTMQKMSLIDDPFERDELALFLDRLATQFAVSRMALIELPLTEVERTLLDEQGKLTGTAIPIQRQIVDFLVGDQFEEAQQVLAEAMAIGARERRKPSARSLAGVEQVLRRARLQPAV